MNKEILESPTPIVFMAMFWRGGGSMTIADILWALDWVDRSDLDRGEMEEALNTLLAAGLIERRDDRFLITKTRYWEFRAFRKRRRRNRFDTARLYFKQLPDVPHVPRVVRLTQKQYKAHIEAYEKAFNEVWTRLKEKDG